MEKYISYFAHQHKCYCAVKGARGKVSFYSQNDKYASQFSCDASPDAYLSHLTFQMTNALHNYPE
jgi:hypothetical protein